MKTRWIIGVLLGVVWLGAVPAVYADGGDASLIHACVQVHNQSVSIVGANDACKANQVAVHWSITGPQGLKGDKGDTGAEGAPGLLASFDELDGLMCTLNGQAGTVDVSYSAGGAVLRCVTAARFFDNGDGTITDTQTGLQWEKKTDDGSVHDKDNAYSWTITADNNFTNPDGTAFTDFLERVNGKLCALSTCQGLGGHSDWRLPTIAELRTILDCSFSPCINPIFGLTAASDYWSSTALADFPGGAWFVFFSNGDVFFDFKNSGNGHVRAVRGGS